MVNVIIINNYPIMQRKSEMFFDYIVKNKGFILNKQSKRMIANKKRPPIA